MLVNEYVEVETVPDYLLNKKDEVTFTQDRDLTTRAVEMLEMWGIYSAYSSKCGFKPVSIYRMLNKINKRDVLFIENDIDFIESVLLRLKTSKSLKDNEKYKIIELYYKGIDVVFDGFERSQKLTTREIGNIINMPKSTVHDKIKEVQSYVSAELARSEYVY